MKSLNFIKKFYNLFRNNIVKSMTLSIAYRVISIMVSFLYVPIALNYLGKERYGVWVAILSMLSWIASMDIGLGNGMRNKLTAALVEKDNKEECSKIVSSTYFIIGIIMFIGTLFCVIILFFLDMKKFLNASEIADNISLVAIISAIFSGIYFEISICKNILYAIQKAHLVSMLNLLGQTTVFLSVFILSQYLKPNLLYIAIAYGISNVIFEIIFSIVIFSKYNFLFPRIKNFCKKTAISIATLSIKFFILQIMAMVVFATDTLIIIKLYGPVQVTFYSIINKVYVGVISAITMFFVPLWSAVTKAKVKGDYIWIKNLIKKIHLIMMPIILLSIILGLLFPFIAKIWLRETLSYPTGLIFLMSIYLIVYIWCYAYSMLTNGMEIMRITLLLAILQGVINIPLSLFLAQVLNLKTNGVLLGTILTMLIQGIIIPIYLNNFLHHKIKLASTIKCKS